MTLLWHVGTGLPWDWQSGPSGSSERQHMQELLDELPDHSLIIADAGFVGYDFWKSILAAKKDFLIRVGANVKLIKPLGYARENGSTVSLWPDQVARKKEPPLVLRLIVIHNGRHPVYLVTNITNKKLLSDKQACEIYHHRWGIELFFRTFKQTFGRQKLRSRNAENARMELDWSLLALWMICLLGQCELVQSGEDPFQLSPALAIKAVQFILREYRVRPESPAETLGCLLVKSQRDQYIRNGSKTSRNYPRKKKKKQIGSPTIIPATKQQIETAKELKKTKPKFHFTA